MGFFDAAVAGAKQAPPPRPAPSGLGAVVQAVASGAQQGAQQAASSNMGAAAAVGASQGAAQIKAAAQHADQQIAQAVQNVPNRPLMVAPQKLAFMNNIVKYDQQVWALKNYMTQNGYVRTANSLGVHPLSLLWLDLGKNDRTFLASFMSASRPMATTPDSMPLKGGAPPLPSPQGWSPKPIPNKAFAYPPQMHGQQAPGWRA